MQRQHVPHVLVSNRSVHLQQRLQPLAHVLVRHRSKEPRPELLKIGRGSLAVRAEDTKKPFERPKDVAEVNHATMLQEMSEPRHPVEGLVVFSLTASLINLSTSMRLQLLSILSSNSAKVDIWHIHKGSEELLDWSYWMTEALPRPCTLS